jgi:uncharacterized protein (DUF488 family)
MAAVVHTIGHSTRPLTDLVDLLRAHRILCVVDVRTVPRSRRNPQFNSDSLRESLPAAGIEYVHAPDLGGLRRPDPDSQRNAAWRNASFRGFADYMQTERFTCALEALVERARTTHLAIMCAESVPWRCHRSLISDALTARGVAVAHILTERTPQPHRMTPFAKVEGDRVHYPPEQGEMFEE